MFSNYTLEALSEDKKYGLLYNRKNDYLLSYSKKDFHDKEELLNYEDIKLFLYENDFLYSDKEKEAIQEKIDELSNSENKMMLIIKVTKDCNFRCKYCYEKFEDSFMDSYDALIILKFIENKIKSEKINQLIINWFGGEPLLNMKYIEEFSSKIIPLCKKYDVKYIGSITTNGYLLNSGVFTKLLSLGISSFQITIDGFKENHDSQRVLKNQQPTFNKILNNLEDISCIHGEFAIILRINMNRKIFNDIEKIIAWTDDITKKCDNIFISLHSVIDYNTMDRYISDIELLDSMKYLINEGQRLINLRNYLSLQNSLCYASKKNHYVIDTDLFVYKCTIEDNRLDSIGKINDDGTIILNKLRNQIKKNNSNCLDCEHFPSCGGGTCPYYTSKYGKNKCMNFYQYEKYLLSLINEQGLYDLTLELED